MEELQFAKEEAYFPLRLSPLIDCRQQIILER